MIEDQNITVLVAEDDDGPCVTPADNLPEVVSRERDITNNIPINNIPKNQEDREATQRRGRGRPALHGLSNTPTYYSYREAKKRCCNPNNPQFKDYGGRGIEFRFGSIEELVAAIGERPAGHDLDRVDGSGHYEPRNVKWSTPTEQAQNRRLPGERTDSYQHRAISARWNREKDARAEWRLRTHHWSQSIKYFNQRYLSDDEIKELRAVKKNCGAPASTFEHSDPRDWAGDLGHISLPSLTRPGERVVLQAGPFGLLDWCADMEHGYLAGMKRTDILLNCTEEERSEINEYMDEVKGTGRTGLCLTGTSLTTTTDIPIEGRLLAIAAALSKKRAVSFVPSCVLLAQLYDKDTYQYDDRCLIVPDLHIGNSGATGFGYRAAPLLRYLLGRRAEHRSPTILYVMDPIALGEEVAFFLEENYRMQDLGSLPARKQKDNIL
ncbi:MAG: hypothetical protein EPO08_02345 [Rhodospirillaceae bacterium]|nr:MAG: hypothetical protein EPO08_02345 [Rhodospirillaceae bacterium]